MTSLARTIEVTLRGYPEFDPDEPRDEHGQWEGGGGDSGTSEGSKPSGAGTAAVDIAALSRSYSRRSPGASEKQRDVAAVYSLNEAGLAAAGRASVTPVEFHELTPAGAARFHAAISAAKAGDAKFGAAVYAYPVEAYRDMRTFVTPDGKSGFALKGDDIVSLFKSPGVQTKGLGHSALALAVQQGGHRLDAFDTVLPAIYSQNGFRAVARLAWDENQKPPDWKYDSFKAFNGGRPDVVFMTYDPAGTALYKPGDGKRVSDYNAGVVAQDAALASAADYSNLKSMPREIEGVSIQKKPLGGAMLAIGGSGGIAVSTSKRAAVAWKDMKAYQKKAYDVGWMSSPHPNHTIWHELAHVKVKQDSSDKDSMLSNLRGSSNPTFEKMAAQVSKYAGVNGHEFVAEVFAATRAGRKLSPEVLAYYDHLGGPKS